MSADDAAMTTNPEPRTPRSTQKISLFGAKKRAQELALEADQLEAQLDRLGALEVIELEKLKIELEHQVGAQKAQLEREQAAATAQQEAELAKIAGDIQTASKQLAELRQDVVVTEETVLMQEAGVYEYRHPLDDSMKYKDELDSIKARIKQMVKKDGGAITAASGWTVNGSEAQGRKMVNDYSKLMLRAYNAEADNLVRGMKPYKLESGIERLRKVALTIERLGKTMSIEVNDDYETLRNRELTLTADYINMRAQEKEAEREEKARLREEKQAQMEFEKAREKLMKEQSHYANALEKLVAAGDEEGAQRLRDQLADVAKAIEDVDYRAAHIRAGYVYVVSNVGSFGERIVKIGMTRRLEPADRVKELGDASVPFNFDTHTLFFSNDAVTVEADLHKHFADKRVNRVNLRREYFYVTPAEVRDALIELAAGEVLHFEEKPEAAEYNQSIGERDQELVAPGTGA
ncbi:MAG: chromosome segregation ATPase [Thermoleophilia bacterium]|nr:chromosome segregation ATPase [Thermoleophilia bacterium]